MIERGDAERLDAADQLAPFRERFVIGDPETLYLDGNSLGRLPLATRQALRERIDQWGSQLVTGWHEWIDIPRAPALEAGQSRGGRETLGMDDLDIGRTLLLWVWAFGLAGIEIEIEGGHGWAERLPTWYFKRGRFGRVFAWVMGQRPLTGYHVFAFTIPMLLLHLPFVSGVEWTLSGELLVVGTYFALAVIWDYLWFVLNPAYTVARFERGRVWWFEVPWIWRFPLDYYTGMAVSVALAALAAWSAGDWDPLVTHLSLLVGSALLTALTVLAAPLYWRWYRHMRRAGADDRAVTRTYPPPAPEAVWTGGKPDLHPLD